MQELARMAEQTYRSPVSKLLSFFQRSRDRWKTKCKGAKKEVKSLKVRMAKLKASRDRWKQLACQAAESGRKLAAREEDAAAKTCPR
jgi:hypothetical protein